jgi:hypothetical protein
LEGSLLALQLVHNQPKISEYGNITHHALPALPLPNVHRITLFLF